MPAEAKTDDKLLETLVGKMFAVLVVRIGIEDKLSESKEMVGIPVAVIMPLEEVIVKLILEAKAAVTEAN